MGTTIADERQAQTLSLMLATSAARLPLFLGRSLPVIANVVSAFALVVSAVIFDITVPLAAVQPPNLPIVVCSVSCTGLSRRIMEGIPWALDSARSLHHLDRCSLRLTGMNSPP